MRQKPIQQSEADSNATREAMAVNAEREQIEILKKQSESIVNAPGDRAPIPEKVEWKVTYSPVNDTGDPLPSRSARGPFAHIC